MQKAWTSIGWLLALAMMAGCAKPVVVYRSGIPSRGVPMVNYGVDFSFARFSDPHLGSREALEDIIPTLNKEITIKMNERLVELFEVRSTLMLSKAGNSRIAEDAFEFEWSEQRSNQVPGEELIEGIVDRYRESSKDGVGFLLLVDFAVAEGPIQGFGILWEQESGDTLLMVRGRGLAVGWGTLYRYLDGLSEVADQVTEGIAQSLGPAPAD